jgi:Ca-activated chloride channel family protein
MLRNKLRHVWLGTVTVAAALAGVGCSSSSSPSSGGKTIDVPAGTTGAGTGTGTGNGAADQTTTLSGGAGSTFGGAAGTTGAAGTGASQPYPAVAGAAGAGPANAPPVNSGSFGNVGTGGGQDFAAFRAALAAGLIPGTATLDASGFFAEHFTSLPAPTCGQTFCLHGMLSVSPDLANGGNWTLLQMAMNSPIDPATVAKPPLDIVVVLDRSGSMADAGKMDYAHQGIKLLVDALGEADTFTFVAFDDQIQTLFGPARVTDKTAIKALVDSVQPRGSTDIYDGLEAGYKAALSVGDETQQRRVIFLTDGLPTAGNTDHTAIEAMSAGYNQKYVGLTTIGLGTDVDAGLLRQLSDQGGGNFYFVEKPDAVTEVFTQELAFFVAPIAYDLELSFGELPAYSIKQVYGTNLWKKTPSGGTVAIPSVFLVSRTSSMPDATGGRRGGGSAIMAELGPDATEIPSTGTCDVAQLHLKYRLPGSQTIETQDATVSYDVGNVATVTTGDAATGYYSSKDVEKNTIILGLFVELRDTTTLAQTNPAAALAKLTAFQPKFTARIAGWADADLIDDVSIVQQYVDVLKAHAP